jgi:AbiV family abortive infection protein
MPTSPFYLLKGASYSLEQCGFLLRDATVLYRSGSYATVVVLVVLGREEMGRSKILLEMWKEALAGKVFTIADINDRCRDHVRKQEMGMLSTTVRAASPVFARALQAPRETTWFRDARAIVDAVARVVARRTPTDRHQSRMAAQYVDPKSETEWNRPADTLRSNACTALSDAVDEYRVRSEKCYIQPDGSSRQLSDQELTNALMGWPERPTLVSLESVFDSSALT